MPEINIILIVSTMSLVINILSIIVLVDFCVKHEKLTNKIQALDSSMKKEKYSDTGRGMRKECSRAAQGCLKTNFYVFTYCTRTTSKQQVAQGYGEVKCYPLRILDLRRLKEMFISYSVHSPNVNQMLNHGQLRTESSPRLERSGQSNIGSWPSITEDNMVGRGI